MSKIALSIPTPPPSAIASTSSASQALGESFKSILEEGHRVDALVTQNVHEGRDMSQVAPMLSQFSLEVEALKSITDTITSGVRKLVFETNV